MSERTLEQAKAIVDTAIKFGVWSWDDGVDPSEALNLSTADTILEAATQGAAKGSVNDAVLEILFAAGVEPTSDSSREAFAKRFNVQLSTPAAPVAAAEPAQATGGAFAQPTPADASAMAQASAAPVTEPQPSASSAPSPAPTAEQVNAIFGGMVYDDLKAAQIKAAVIDAAASGELSPEEWETIKAYEDRDGGEGRKTVLSLTPEFKAPEPPPTAPSATGAFAPATPVSGVEFFAAGADGSESISAFYNGETVSRAQQEGLPIPAQPQVDPAIIVMPIDITATGDAELSRLATIYHSLFARTQWLISQEEGRERAAEQLEHDAHRDAYTGAYENHKSAIAEGKSGPTALDAARKLAEKDADGAEPVHKWRTRKIRHGIDARELKALASGFDKAVWRINEELERRSRLQVSTQATR